MANITQHVPDTLVKTWIDQHAPQRHAVFRSQGFSSQRANVPKTKQQSVGDFTNDFCDIIQKYGNILPADASATSINIRGAHSWDEVIRAAKDAEAAYLAEARGGAKGPVRNLFRRFGDYSATLTPWVGLLPSDQYFSILCGSLKIVLGVAARRSERRIMIFETFETLPTVIEKTQRCHDLFSDSLELRDRALTVYLDMLTMIDAMIASLMDKKLLHRIKDGLKGPLADQDLDEKRRRFQLSMGALEDQAEHLHRVSLAKTSASIAVMAPSVQVTKQIVHSIDARTKALNDSVMGVSTSMDGLQLEVNLHDQTTQALRIEIELQRQAIDSLSSVLHDVVANNEWGKAQVRNAWVAIDRGSEARSLQRQLEIHLDESAAAVSQDLNLVCRGAQQCDARSQGAMHWVLQSPRFKRWIQSPSPDVLAVNGSLEDGMARYSSTSLLCGMLVQSLQEQKAVYVLHFFCGTHSSRLDPLSGPGGLVRSLIAQLLAVQEFDVGFLGLEYWAEGLRTNSVRTLGQLFRRLFEQLPNSMVFCIIDSISILEVETWVHELQLVMGTLLETVADEHLSARLKLLMTAASRSPYLDSLLGENNRLFVPTDVGNQRLLTSRSAHSELGDGRRSPMYRAGGYSSYEDVYDAGFE